MAQGPPPPPSHGGSNTVMIRNIATGVITTVLGAAIIYFLGFHKSGGGSSAESMLVTKENTINAWKSYVNYENNFWGNWKIYASNYTEAGFENYKNNTLSELERFNNDIKKLLETGTLDPSFASFLERRLDSKQQWEKKYRKHLDKYERLTGSATDPQEKTTKQNEEVSRFQKDVKELDEKFANEIGELCTALTSKYSYNFSWADLKMYQSTTATTNVNTNTGTNAGNSGSTTTDGWKKLVGKWQTSDGANKVGTLYQYEDGRMYYYFASGDSTHGRWEFGNNQLTLHYERYWGAGQAFTYNLSNVADNSFTMTFTSSPFNVFSATKLTY
ncbi:MAG: hypothetical protein WDN26_09525 [Chitinophagaceae bacterium]